MNTQALIDEVVEKFDSIGDAGRAWLRMKLEELAEPLNEIVEAYRLVKEFGPGHIFDLQAAVQKAAGMVVTTTTGRSFYVRPKVRAFAELMETKLRKHDETRGANGWVNDDPLDLLVRMREEGEELEDAVIEESKEAQAEAADVANLAMMVADVCGGLVSGEPWAQMPRGAKTDGDAWVGVAAGYEKLVQDMVTELGIPTRVAQACVARTCGWIEKAPKE